MGRSTAELVPVPAPADQPLSTDLCWLLSRASYTLTTELTAAFEGLGLSPRANCVIRSEPGATGTVRNTICVRRGANCRMS